MGTAGFYIIHRRSRVKLFLSGLLGWFFLVASVGPCWARMGFHGGFLGLDSVPVTGTS